MFSRIVFLISLTTIFFTGVAQSDTTIKKNFKRKFYVLWGYTEAWYSKSDIRFQNNGNYYSAKNQKTYNYDFSVYDAKAHDRRDFDQIIDIANVTIPQFVGCVGFCLTDKWDFEINYDHTKYIVFDYQKVRIKGHINNVWMNQDTILNGEDLFHLEHTDGANFLMFNAVRKFNMINDNPNFLIQGVVKSGGGIVLPRTDVTLFGERLNNDWKIAGCIFGVESGLRLNFCKYGLFELTCKGSWANYINAFALGKGNGKVSHHFFAGQLTATIGLIIGEK